MTQIRENLRHVRVKQAYKAEYADPIQVPRGAKVVVGREDDDFPGWRWCKAQDGREGWIPVELLSSGGLEATVLEDYSARELDVEAGEDLVVEDARHQWLRVRNSRDQRGWIPESHVDEQNF